MKTQLVERRLYKRCDDSVLVKYILPDGVSGTATTKNISMEGARFQLPEELDVEQGTRFTLKIQIPGRNRPTVIVAEIVWRRKFETSPGDNYDIGIRFVQVDPFDIEEIINKLKK